MVDVWMHFMNHAKCFTWNKIQYFVLIAQTGNRINVLNARIVYIRKRVKYQMVKMKIKFVFLNVRFVFVLFILNVLMFQCKYYHQGTFISLVQTTFYVQNALKRSKIHPLLILIIFKKVKFWSNLYSYMQSYHLQFIVFGFQGCNCRKDKNRECQ